MWDYNIGIVRITHLFKCNGYSKASSQGGSLMDSGLLTRYRLLQPRC